jgi:hypothetical protein
MVKVYRPQLAFSCPPHFEDVAFHYTFDGTNTKLLNGNLAAGANIMNIPLVMQPDAPFLLRVIKVQGTAGKGSELDIWFKDPFGNELSDATVAINNYAAPGGGQVIGTQPVVFEPGIRCPIGTVFWIYEIQNRTSGSVALPKITFQGYKRFSKTSREEFCR